MLLRNRTGGVIEITELGPHLKIRPFLTLSRLHLDFNSFILLELIVDQRREVMRSSLSSRYTEQRHRTSVVAAVLRV